MLLGIETFLATVFLSWYGLGALVLAGIIFEYFSARKMSVLIGIGTIAAAYYFFQLPLKTLLFGIGGYITIGLIWSFWRYHRHVNVEIRLLVEKYGVDALKDKFKVRELHPKAMIGTIVAWIIVWPFSMVESACGDVIYFIDQLVRTAFKQVYNRIYNSALKKFNIPTT